MIICISANPAIDRRVRLRELNIGDVNRALSVDAFAGGKAAHVAMAATVLGEKAVWVGFLGGSTGDTIASQLTDLGVNVIAVNTATATRSNDEIIDEHGCVTEILEPGGPVTESELRQFRNVCGKLFAKQEAGFQVILSGSLPPGVPDDLYAELTTSARDRGGIVTLDASGTALIKGIAAGPDLIKPNAHESAGAVGFAIENEAAAVDAICRFRDIGAHSVAISMGVHGIIWSDKANRTLIATPPTVETISTVGCGDAAVAGYAVAASRGLNETETLRLAVACGTANCLAPLPGQIRLADVERLRPDVSIRTIG